MRIDFSLTFMKVLVLLNGVVPPARTTDIVYDTDINMVRCLPCFSPCVQGEGRLVSIVDGILASSYYIQIRKLQGKVEVFG